MLVAERGQAHMQVRLVLLQAAQQALRSLDFFFQTDRGCNHRSCNHGCEHECKHQVVMHQVASTKREFSKRE